MQHLFPNLNALRGALARRASPALLACALALPLLFLSGCAGPDKYAAGSDFDPASHEYLRPDIENAFDVCVAMCMENNSVALVTRTGCLEGCNELHRQSPLRGRTFRTREACANAVGGTAMNRDALRQEMRSWCDATWTHIHNRKGCYNATETYYAALTPERLCGASYTPPPPAAATPSEETTTAVPVPTVTPASESVQQPKAVTPVPAPAAPVPSPAAPAGGTPRIHDSPKYQSRSAVKPATTTKTQTPPTGTPATQPAQVKPAAEGSLAPPSSTVHPRQTAPAVPPRPAATHPELPEPMSAQPAIPSPPTPATPETRLAAPATPSVPSAGAAASPGISAVSPSPPTPLPESQPVPETTGTYTVPRLSVPSPGPRGAYSTSGTVTTPRTAEPSPGTTSTGRLPLSGPPPQTAAPSAAPGYTGAPPALPPTVAGSGAGQPPSASATNPAPGPTPDEQAGATSGQSAVMPPVPSMLHQPYRPPATITPQTN